MTNLNSVKKWCTYGYCSVMPANKESLCCRDIDDIVLKKLSDDILIFSDLCYTYSLIFSFF